MVMAFPSKNDILIAMKNQVCYRSKDLIGGAVFQKGTRVNYHSGGYASVFPFTKANGEKVVVRCWFADIGDPKKRMLTISAHLTALNCPYFVNFEYHESALLINGILYPVVTMDWVEYPTLKDFLNDHISDRAIILKIAENFRNMVRYFHQNNIAHGDLSHGNIKLKNDGSLLLIDYDSMYVQGLSGMADVIKGLPGYQHPCRSKNEFVHSKLDYFSELVIYLSLLVYADHPDLWVKYYETEDLLFSKEDYDSPQSSALFKILESSSNTAITDLTKKLVSCLSHHDIAELKPLEEMVKDKLDDIADEIIDKF